MLMALERIDSLPNGYDTEDEDSRGPGFQERCSDDYGEKAINFKEAFNRATRKIARNVATKRASRL